MQEIIVFLLPQYFTHRATNTTHAETKKGLLQCVRLGMAVSAAFSSK
jgi:hypothetical protein